VKITKGFMPWWCFIIPKTDTENIKRFNRVYWLGFVFHREYKARFKCPVCDGLGTVECIDDDTSMVCPGCKGAKVVNLQMWFRYWRFVLLRK